jgi:hypothetical protein
MWLGRSGGSPLKGSIGGELHRMWDDRGAAHIEFENARYHDDGLGLMSILKEGEAERFCAIDEQATTTVVLA